MNFIIAWRNIWRNKKRTYITISSIILAVVLAVFTRSFNEGTYVKMIENSVGQLTGYVNIHNKDYWEDKTLDNGMEITPDLINTAKSVKGVEDVTLKIESFALAAFEKSTKGTLLIGISPEKEDHYAKLKSKIIDGEYLEENDPSILIGSRLANYLKISVGDSLVLMGQGHFGQSAIGAYPIKGIVKMPSPIIDRQIIYMPLALAQDYLSFPSGVTSIVIRIEEGDLSDEICETLNHKMDTNIHKAMTWEEMTPELIQMIEGDRAGGLLMIGILYMIIAFGVFGTVLMMTEERKKEFAVMISIGMQKSQLAVISVIEMIYINAIGIAVGIALTIPIVVYFHYNPITMTGEMAKSIEQFGMEPELPTLMEFSIFKEQILIILVITAIAAIYPVFAIMKLKLINALRK